MRPAVLAAVLLAGCATAPRGSLGRQRVLEDRDMVWSIALSPDGARAAVVRLGASDYLLSCFELAHPDAPRWEVAVNPNALDVEVVEFSNDGTLLATAGQDGAVRLFGAADGKALGVRVLRSPQRALVWHPTGGAVLVGGDDGAVTVLATPSLEVLGSARLHTSSVRGLAFAGQDTLFSGSWDKTVWETTAGPSGELVAQREMKFPWFINDLTVDQKGKVLGLAMSEVKAERTPEVRAREKKGEVDPQGEGNCAARVEAATGKILTCAKSHRGVVASAAISPDGETLASGGWDHQVVLSAGTQTSARAFGWAIRRVRFSRDGKTLAVAAWTPPNPVGTRHSAPSAVVFDLQP